MSRSQNAGGNGSRARIMASRRMITEQMRDDYSPQWISMWLGEIAQGRDPRVTLREIDPKTGNIRAGRPRTYANSVEEVPTLEQSMHAMAQIMLRRDGAPEQSIKLDQELRARVTSLQAQLNLDSLASLPLDEIEAKRASLRALLEGLTVKRDLGNSSSEKELPELSSGDGSLSSGDGSLSSGDGLLNSSDDHTNAIDVPSELVATKSK